MNFDVATLATDVMSAFLVDLAGDSTFSIPARQYVTACQEVAFDCEELVVWGSRIYTGLGGIGGQARTREDVVFFAELHVTVVRCVPVPGSETEMVPAADLDTSGRQILNDGGALLRAAVAAWQRGAFGGGCSNLVLGPVEWTTPDGMLVGSTLTIQLEL